MNKRTKKKHGLTKQEEQTPNIPIQLIEKIKEVIKTCLSEGEEEDYIPNEKVEVTPRVNWKKEDVISVEVDDGKILESNSSPNYYGNWIAQELIEEIKEIEFIGFDCKYDVKLEFKLRKN